MGNEEDKKGFTIRDRRSASQTEEAKPAEDSKEEGKKEPREEKRPAETENPVLLEIDFSSFVFSLGTSALLHLGEVPDPVTKKVEKDLSLAKQTIDILGMLKEKTRGTLTGDEEKLIENLLADLRWRFVREAKG
jgi:hypothetical protein